MKNATAARYTPAGGGRILFVRNDNLYAQTLNRTARKLEDEPELVQQSVASSPAFHRAHFSVSRTGGMAWRPGTAGLSQVTIFDRQGKEIGTAGSPAVVQMLKLAPDETRLLLGYNYTAWLLEPGRPGRLQLEQGSLTTLFSPDGPSSSMQFPPTGGIVLRVVERPVTGEGTARELARPPGLRRLEDISPDGKTLLFSRGALDTTVFSFRAGRRADTTQIPGPDRRDDLPRTLLARRALDCVQRLGGWERRYLQRRRNLRSAVPGAGLTEAGDQPRQLSSVAQGWAGNRLPGWTPGPDLHLVGSRSRSGRRGPRRYSFAPVPCSSSRDHVWRSELPGGLARRFALLYPPSCGATGV